MTTGCHLPRVSRYLASLGATYGTFASRHHLILWLVCDVIAFSTQRATVLYHSILVVCAEVI